MLAQHAALPIWPRKRKRDIRLDEARLVAAIMPLAVEGEAVKGLPADQLGHCVGKLDFAARPLFLPLQYAHHLGLDKGAAGKRSEEHTSELQSLMRISYAVFCLKKKKRHH